MNLGNLIYAMFPLYFGLLYLTLNERFQYITLPLIAFINILAVLWIMFGSMDSSDLFIIAINAALILFTIYMFSNATISWFLSLLYIGATSIGGAKPNEMFNLTTVLFTMLFLSVAIIISTVAVGKTQAKASNSLGEKVVLPQQYRQMFEQLKSAMVISLALSLLILGVNNSVVSGIEQNPSQPEMATPSGRLAGMVSSVLTIFSGVWIVVAGGAGAIGSVFKWGVDVIWTGISSIIKTVLRLILIMFTLLMSLFMDNAAISNIVSNLQNGLMSYLLSVKNALILVAGTLMGYIASYTSQLLTFISSLIGMAVGTSYNKTKGERSSLSPWNVLVLTAVAAFSSTNLYIAFSQLHNGFELLRLPNMLNTN